MGVGTFIHNFLHEMCAEATRTYFVQFSGFYSFEIDGVGKIREHDLNLPAIIIDLKYDFTRPIAFISMLDDIHARFIDCNDQIGHELLGALELPSCLLNLIPNHFQSFGIR